MGFLTDVISRVRDELDEHPLDDSRLMARAGVLPPTRDFGSALMSRRPSVIAEIKRASPSAGSIADTDPAARARAYETAGASAISVLTEARHFEGSISDLKATRTATSLPVLRKDFLVHPSQIIESRAEGADAVLLIAACLTEAELDAMLAAASDLGLSSLVETHSEEDLEKALRVRAPIVGVNARDLETLDVDAERALALLAQVPEGTTAVLESGISSRGQIERAVEAGADAVLVGEALMRAADPGAMLRELLGEVPR